MRKLFVVLMLLCVRVQAQNIEGQPIASQFGTWKVPAQSTGGSLSFPVATCQVAGGGSNFSALTKGVPIKIVDANPNLNEIVTPSSAFPEGCTVNFTPAYVHQPPYYLTSGTGGLQEAINATGAVLVGTNAIILDSRWYELITPRNAAAVISSVKGSSYLPLVDITAVPYTWYSWNGSTYVAVLLGGGATTPATSNLLKGNGSANGVVAATPGTDYVIPSGNITGTAGGLSGTPALPNGTTATTQTTGDNTTKVATDAFVLANAGSSSPFQSLTTTGSSGAATLNSGVLNIPQYAGGSGSPGGSTTQAQFNNAGSFAGAPGVTFDTSGNVTQVANVRYLSCASELGAQINAAVTSLGAGGGKIILPNCTTATMTTTATNLPLNISLLGYGKTSTVISCTVAGDCIQTSMNATNVGENGAEIAGFRIFGNGASNQVLLHANGMSGYTLHDLYFQGGSAGSAVCLEFDNSATGMFTERNRTYNVVLDQQCTPNVLFNQSGSDSSTSFAYNTFEFGMAIGTGGTNYGVVFTGNSQLYGGILDITANYAGSGGGVIDFVGNVNASGTSGGLQGQKLFVSVENNSGNAGTIINVPSTGSQLAFESTILNGAGGAPALGTVSNVAAGSYLYLNSPLGAQGNVGSGFYSAVASDYNYSSTSGSGPRNFWCPNMSSGYCGQTLGVNSSHNLDTLYNESNGVSWLIDTATIMNLTNTGGLTVTGQGAQTQMLDLVGGSSGGGTGFTLDASGQSGGKKMQVNISGANFYLYDSTDNTNIVSGVGNGSFTNTWKVGSLGIFGWDSASQYAATGTDTGFSRTAAATIALGNGTQGDVSGAAVLARIVLRGGTSPTITGCGTISSQAGGSTAGSFVTSTTGTCTAAFALPTVTHGYTCEAHDITQHVAANDLRQSATSTTGCTVTGTTVANDVITFTAIGW